MMWSTLFSMGEHFYVLRNIRTKKKTFLLFLLQGVCVRFLCVCVCVK